MFTEREENVKADIFHAYIALLKQTKPSGVSGRENNSGYGSNFELNNLLIQQVPLILKATCRQMKVTCSLTVVFNFGVWFNETYFDLSRIKV